METINSILSFLSLVGSHVVSIAAFACLGALMLFEDKIRQIPVLGRFPYIGSLFMGAAFILGAVAYGPVKYQQGKAEGAKAEIAKAEEAAKKRQIQSDKAIFDIEAEWREKLEKARKGANENILSLNKRIGELESQEPVEIPPVIISCEGTNEKITCPRQKLPNFYRLPADSKLLRSIRRSRK